MKFEIVGRPDFWFHLDPAQLKVLISLSNVHYDATCRAAASVGGFIYGWKNSLDWNPATKVKGAWRELDTCLKILEGLQVPPANMPDCYQTVGHKLVKSFRTALFRSNDEVAQWKTEIDV